MSLWIQRGWFARWRHKGSVFSQNTLQHYLTFYNFLTQAGISPSPDSRGRPRHLAQPAGWGSRPGWRVAGCCRGAERQRSDRGGGARKRVRLRTPAGALRCPCAVRAPALRLHRAVRIAHAPKKDIFIFIISKGVLRSVPWSVSWSVLWSVSWVCLAALVFSALRVLWSVLCSVRYAVPFSVLYIRRIRPPTAGSS